MQTIGPIEVLIVAYKPGSRVAAAGADGVDGVWANKAVVANRLSRPVRIIGTFYSAIARIKKGTPYRKPERNKRLIAWCGYLSTRNDRRRYRYTERNAPKPGLVRTVFPLPSPQRGARQADRTRHHGSSRQYIPRRLLPRQAC